MTWKETNLVLQWGSLPPGGRPGRPAGGYTLHLPPTAPAHAVVKSARLLREWTGAPLRRGRSARWVTLGVTGRPGRWATGAVLRGNQLNLTTRAVRRLTRTDDYDVARWRYPVRGVTLVTLPWGAALNAETQLVRPRYV